MKILFFTLLFLGTIAKAQFLDEKSVPLPFYVEKNFVDDSLQHLLAKHSQSSERIVSVYRDVLGKKSSEKYLYKVKQSNSPQIKVLVARSKHYPNVISKSFARYETTLLGEKKILV